MENLEIYKKFKSVPAEAKKTIAAGRLKGFTDINPMWRIKMLTEEFGPCGTGWYTEVTNRWSENTGTETAVFVELNLYVKIDNEWSKPIYGTGGSQLLTQESKGPYTNNECYKMAYTDALGIACKALGMAADVYFEKDRTKYDLPDSYDSQKPKIDEVEQKIKSCQDSETLKSLWENYKSSPEKDRIKTLIINRNKQLHATN